MLDMCQQLDSHDHCRDFAMTGERRAGYFYPETNSDLSHAFEMTKYEYYVYNDIWNMVPEVGIEPTCPCERGILSPLRLPVSPLRHGRDYISGVQKVKLKSVDKPLNPVLSRLHNFSVFFGVVAQLGERMTGSHEVRGSIPLSSTK